MSGPGFSAILAEIEDECCPESGLDPERGAANALCESYLECREGAVSPSRLEKRRVLSKTVKEKVTATNELSDRKEGNVKVESVMEEEPTVENESQLNQESKVKEKLKVKEES